MKPIFLALAVTVFLGNCTSQEQPKATVSKRVAAVVTPAKKPQVRKYSGIYYRGDGLGYNVNLNLKADGTYTGVWRGCLGVYGTASGRWNAKGQRVVLKPMKETGAMEGHLRTLDIIYQQKKIVLLPTTDRKERTKWGIPKFLYFQKRK